ncbi:hypothetical protein D8S78_00820 [Natrialba swarupiae]|nr:hypothetical protein [Natrialba swarupiae]
MDGVEIRLYQSADDDGEADRRRPEHRLAHLELESRLGHRELGYVHRREHRDVHRSPEESVADDAQQVRPDDVNAPAERVERALTLDDDRRVENCRNMKTTKNTRKNTIPIIAKIPIPTGSPPGVELHGGESDPERDRRDSGHEEHGDKQGDHQPDEQDLCPEHRDVPLLSDLEEPIERRCSLESLEGHPEDAGEEKRPDDDRDSESDQTEEGDQRERFGELAERRHLLDRHYRHPDDEYHRISLEDRYTVAERGEYCHRN